jgi:hypothetical protein
MSTRAEYNSYFKFLDTYNGKKLLADHTVEEYGTWQIYGEDPNCDLGGCHTEPSLGVREGRLQDVIVEAVAMDGFWRWGHGGRIDKIMAIKTKAGEVRPEQSKGLFTLIRTKTHQGKLTWRGDRYRLLADVGDMTIELGFQDSQRDGEWHTLNVTTSKGPIPSFATEAQIIELYDYIIEHFLNKPINDAVSEALNTLESL